ncbi:TPA: DUF600 family protein [Pseudomonas aeruginosa]|nr:DUF600 family protein [Pseudomonas aeruginosa]
MMTREIEALYPQIGQAAVDAVPGNFKKLWAIAEMLDDVSGTEIFYQAENGEIYHIYDNIDELDELLFKLRKVFAGTGNEPWSSVTLTVDQDGKFSLEYGYEDVSDIGLAGERRDKWLAEHFGRDAKINYE